MIDEFRTDPKHANARCPLLFARLLTQFQFNHCS